jgi:hypothetical protein
MKTWKTLAIAIAVVFTVDVLPAQDASKAGKALSMADPAKFTKPGEEHEKLARYVGAWNIEIRMGSGAALAYQGAATNRMTVGGRFLQMEFQAQGKSNTTEGIFTLSFDTRHQRFSIIAMDSFGTYFVTSSGKRDEASGKIRMLGTDDDPLMKSMGYTKEFIHIVDFRSLDEYVVEVWFVDTRTSARREFKYMDYVFKRKK